MIRINICFKIQYGGFTFLLKDGCPPQTGQLLGHSKKRIYFHTSIAGSYFFDFQNSFLIAT